MQKEVKSYLRKDDFYFTVYLLIKEGKAPKDICSILNFSKQRLNYYLNALRRENHIKKLGYATWEATKEEVKTSKNLPKGTKKLLIRNIRGHAFQVSLDLPKIDNWNSEKRQEFLKKKGLIFDRDFKNVGLYSKTQSFFFRKNRIWLSDKRITLYWNKNKHYWSQSAKESYKYFAHDLTKLLDSLSIFVGVSLKKNKAYKFKVDKQHYAKVHDALAKQYNRENNKLYVTDQNGLWFLVDNSLNLDESETVHKETAQVDMDEVILPFFNQLKETKLMPQDILHMMQGIQQNQLIFAENMKSHIEAIKKLGNEVEGLAEAIKKVKSKDL